MTTTPDNVSVTTTSATLDGAPTLLFIHGFLDDATVWDGVIASLAGKVNAARYDLPGFGARSTAVADPNQLSLQSLAAEAGEILDDTDTRVIVVGQSLGTQIAELVAAKHADRVDGLVLFTPVPLGGTRLPDEAVAPFRALGGDLDAQRAREANSRRRWQKTSWIGSSDRERRHHRTWWPATSTSGTTEYPTPRPSVSTRGPFS